MRPSRRAVLAGVAAGLVVPGRVLAAGPVHAMMVGDVGGGRAAIWVRTFAPTAFELRWDTGAGRGMRPGNTGPDGDPTAVLALEGLPPGASITASVWVGGQEAAAVRFRTPSEQKASVKFLWSADLAGQGWGIDPARGYAIFDAMLAEDPDFFVCCGDLVYADGPLPAERVLPDGSVWRNVVADGRDHAAIDEADFRGAYRYHLRDPAYVRFFGQVPLIATWDDHEVVDNFAASAEPRTDAALRAWKAYVPARLGELGLFRVIPRGPLLDLIVLDGRSFRSPNVPGEPASWLGKVQSNALIQALKASKAVWKVVISGQPIGERVHHDFRNRTGQDGPADGSSATAARERELNRVLQATSSVRNVVWLTGDVHHAAAHGYHPDRAIEKSFRPFREYVAGPLHAGVFPAGELDPTFGPERRYVLEVPEPGAGPASGTMSYGRVTLDEEGAFDVSLRDGLGRELFGERLLPEPA